MKLSIREIKATKRKGLVVLVIAKGTPIAGIEAIAMLRKNQCRFEINGRVLSIAEQINLMAA